MLLLHPSSTCEAHAIPSESYLPHPSSILNANSCRATSQTHNAEAKFQLRLCENPAKEKRGVRAVHVCDFRAECESGDQEDVWKEEKCCSKPRHSVRIEILFQGHGTPRRNPANPWFAFVGGIRCFRSGRNLIH